MALATAWKAHSSREGEAQMAAEALAGARSLLGKNGEFDGIIQPRGRGCKAGEGQPSGRGALYQAPLLVRWIAQDYNEGCDGALKPIREVQDGRGGSLTRGHSEYARFICGRTRVASQSPTLFIPPQVLGGNQATAPGSNTEPASARAASCCTGACGSVQEGLYIYTHSWQTSRRRTLRGSCRVASW